MKILFAASEGVPFCKTGGLADVVGALPEALAAKRHSVRVVLPYYRTIRQHFPKIKFTGRTVHVMFEARNVPVRILQTDLKPTLRVYFLDEPGFYDRVGLYGGSPGTIYADNDRRYAFFSRAALEAVKAMDFCPDIVHAHDWQTGLLPAYLRLIYREDPYFAKTRSVFTIHNLAYQGNFPPLSFHMTGLPAHAYHPKGLEFYGQVSFLKAGLVYADAVNTVSPTYAKEISTDPMFGCGMEGVLVDRGSDFQGILNGLDVKFWNPRTDKILAHSFDKEDRSGRVACKEDLQAITGLTVDKDIPLLAFIGRLDYQKGIDLLIEGLPSVLKDGVQFVSLGQGNVQYTKDLLGLQHRSPAQVHVKTDFAEPFAHKIYAGADIFLMPSRYEPCGLGQLIAMRYGAVPVVRPTGGLLDTVTDMVQNPEGTGFVAADFTTGAFMSAVRSALQMRNDRAAWDAVQLRGMQKDFSWRSSVRDYLLLYESLIG